MALHHLTELWIQNGYEAWRAEAQEIRTEMNTIHSEMRAIRHMLEENFRMMAERNNSANEVRSNLVTRGF